MNDLLIRLLGYTEAIYIKNLIILTLSFSAALLLIVMFSYVIVRSLRIDKNLPGLLLLRIRQGKKSLYIINPVSVSSTVHASVILACWRLGLNKKQNMLYQDEAGSRKFVYWLIGITTFTVFSAFSLALTTHPDFKQLDNQVEREERRADVLEEELEKERKENQ